MTVPTPEELSIGMAIHPLCGTQSLVFEKRTQATRTEPSKRLPDMGFCKECQTWFEAPDVQPKLATCATCDQPMTRVGHSYRKEAAMSGMCAHCQDAYFGKTAGDFDVDRPCFCNHQGICGAADCGIDRRPRCGTCNHVLGPGDMCLDDEGHAVDCDCEDDGRGKRMFSAVEEFPVAEEVVEDVVTEPRLPDWIENSKTAQDSYRDLGDDDPDTRNPIDNPTCKGCGAWLSPVIKAMDNVPYCTKCIKDGVPTTTR